MAMILLYGVLGLLAITVIGNLMLGRWRAQRTDSRIGARADAYLASLDREGMPETLAAMSAAERREMLVAAGHEARTESDRRFYIATLGGLFAFFVALGFAIEGAGMRDFLLVLGISALALYGVTVVMRRRLKAKMTARGIDIERLRID
ncbi:MAG TPA: hypothetical protein VNS12_03590 [Pelagibacterium sp.]|uniref:hypothetical protein n=1 Tax=Pelagibacterium sp. TaxID=1967288 RepID=UPI002BFCC942|nr:hypothetical protein [Pelagibacterium sp.]HWJ87139.1 hypothetical protein [Pelagibacterium sp.]